MSLDTLERPFAAPPAPEGTPTATPKATTERPLPDRPAPGSAPAPAREYLAFRIGAEEYAIDILRVQEIRSYEVPTRLAQAPASVVGVLNLRGVIVPVVDLRAHLGTPAGVDTSTVTIVLNLRGRTVGVVVDAVCDVVELGGESLRPAPVLGSNAFAEAISGIGSLPQGDLRRTLILVEIETLVAQVDTGLVGITAH